MLILNFFIVILLILFLLTIIIYIILDIYANIVGGPFVPTKSRDIDLILKLAKLKKGKIFYDLGSGDGRIVRKAVQDYGVVGYGFEINFLLIIYSKIITFLKNLKNCFFVNRNLFNVDLRKPDYLFLFLMPKTLERLKKKLLKELKNNALIISHGFKIDNFDQYLINKIDNKPFSTYFYLKKGVHKKSKI